MKSAIKQLIKVLLPDRVAAAIRQARGRGELARFKHLSAEDTFDTVYSTGLWGGGSGTGSEGPWADAYVDFVRKFIEDNAIRSITDVGCGDFRVGAKLA